MCCRVQKSWAEFLEICQKTAQQPFGHEFIRIIIKLLTLLHLEDGHCDNVTWMKLHAANIHCFVALTGQAKNKNLSRHFLGKGRKITKIVKFDKLDIRFVFYA